MTLDLKYQSTSGALILCKLNLRLRKVPEHKQQLPAEKVFRKRTVRLQAVLLLDSTKNCGMRVSNFYLGKRLTSTFTVNALTFYLITG